MTKPTELPEIFRTQWRARPLWMQPLMLFCLFMAVVYMPWDIFVKPLEQDQEVWFGYMFTGWAAKATAPLHWLVYGAGAWGFWHMKRWMCPWAALYCVQVAVGMVVWVLLYQSAASLYVVAAIGLMFLALAWALHKARAVFVNPAS